MTLVFALLFALCVGATAAANAQTGWLPRTVAMGPNISGANRTAAIANLEVVERLLHQVPELAHPDGFEIQPTFTGGGRRLGPSGAAQPANVVEYTLTLYFFYPSQTINPHSVASIEVHLNSAGNHGAWKDDQGTDFLAELHRVDRMPFATIAYGVSETGRESTGLSPTEKSIVEIWFTAGGELPWRSVTREEYYKALISNAEGKNGEKLAVFKNTPHQRWLDEAPKRKREREEVLSTLARVQPAAEVAKLRKEMEDGERETGEQLKKNEGGDVADRQKLFAAIDSMHAELNRMTPAERRIPAILDDPSKRELRVSGVYLRDRDTVAYGISRLLTPKYDFWRARKSPVEVRDIMSIIDASGNLKGPPPAPVHNALWQTYKKLDWRALAALLSEPTHE